MSLPFASDRSFVIEFVGAPGAGKSTMLPVVLAACREAGLAPATVVDAARPLAARTLPGRLVASLPETRFRARLLWLVFRWVGTAASLGNILRTWPLAWWVSSSQLGRASGAEARTRRVVYWYHRLLGAHGLFLRRAVAGEVLLLDEGYVHRVVQLFASAVEVPDPRIVRRYLDAVPVPDLTVAVHAPIECCVGRVRTRGVWTRFEGRDGDEVDRFVRSAHRAVELAVGHAREHGWDLIEVDNGTDGVAASRAALREALAQRLAPGMVGFR